jgi:uncharacterized protein YndB with AHSA1/START domain
MPQLTKPPSVDIGLLIRRPPHDVFEALADPSITTRFWYTKSTYLHITETGFTGDPDTQVRRALDSTAGFTFLLSSLKAALEHDITLRVTMDAHPPNLQMPSPG